MDSFTLGQAPHRMTTVLAAGTDFVAVLQRSDGLDWPAGAEVELVMGATTFAATVTGPNVMFEVDSAQVDAAIALAPKKAKLYYEADGIRLLWAAGPVVLQ